MKKYNKAKIKSLRTACTEDDTRKKWTLIQIIFILPTLYSRFVIKWYFLLNHVRAKI